MPPKRIVAAKAVAARAMARQRIGPLHAQRVSKAAQKRYATAATAFTHWLLQGAFPWPKNYVELDWLICWYLETLWEAGAERNAAGDTISAIQHYLHTRRAFPGAWSLFATWSRTELPARAPPLTSAIMTGLLGIAAMLGRHDAVVLLAVGFHCMLRTEEMLSISWGCLLVGADNLGAVALPHTKTGSIRGAQEVVTIDDQTVGRLVRLCWHHLRQPGGAVLTTSRCEFSRFLYHGWSCRPLRNHLSARRLDILQTATAVIHIC